jgi:hypothetical protein
MSESSHHGHTVAAWALSILMMVAFLVGSLGLILANYTIFWIGVILVPVSGIVGKVLANMGFGKKTNSN